MQPALARTNQQPSAGAITLCYQTIGIITAVIVLKDKGVGITKDRKQATSELLTQF